MDRCEVCGEVYVHYLPSHEEHAYQRGIGEGRRAERADVVAWLRGLFGNRTDPFEWQDSRRSDAIERGDHIGASAKAGEP